MSDPRIVETLTAARQAQDLSMREVARLIGVSPSCVHSWEHGIRKPTLYNVELWARVLGFRLVLTRPTAPAEGRPVQGCMACATYRSEGRACPEHRVTAPDRS